MNDQLVRLPLRYQTKSGLKIRLTRHVNPHPKMRHVQVMLSLEWPRYAEFHFLPLSAAIRMLEKKQISFDQMLPDDEPNADISRRAGDDATAAERTQ